MHMGDMEAREAMGVERERRFRNVQPMHVCKQRYVGEGNGGG